MAGRIGGPKTRCSNTWTEARFKSFIKGNLRSATRKWKPIQDTLKDARVARGLYLCAGCGEHVPNTAKNEETGKREKNIHVDHILPIIDPATGWVSWDDTIERMFCERDNLQLLCSKCHKVKTDEEKAVAKARRTGENDIDEDE